MVGKDRCTLIVGVRAAWAGKYARLFAKGGKDTLALARTRDRLEGLKRELVK